MYLPKNNLVVFEDPNSTSSYLMPVQLLKDDPGAVDVLDSAKTPSGFSEFDDNADYVMGVQVRGVLGL